MKTLQYLTGTPLDILNSIEEAGIIRTTTLIISPDVNLSTLVTQWVSGCIASSGIDSLVDMGACTDIKAPLMLVVDNRSTVNLDDVINLPEQFHGENSLICSGLILEGVTVPEDEKGYAPHELKYKLNTSATIVINTTVNTDSNALSVTPMCNGDDGIRLSTLIAGEKDSFIHVYPRKEGPVEYLLYTREGKISSSLSNWKYLFNLNMETHGWQSPLANVNDSRGRTSTYSELLKKNVYFDPDNKVHNDCLYIECCFRVLSDNVSYILPDVSDIDKDNFFKYVRGTSVMHGEFPSTKGKFQKAHPFFSLIMEYLKWNS